MRVTRRAVLVGAGAALAAPALGNAAAKPVSKSIPATGEAVPAVGLGSWIT
ncbi:MAG: aldo/keto reductase, partial [Rhodospirillaceae bacterium]|nr:aldo/keto reductase [Rhodospirillaceae bacterium]